MEKVRMDLSLQEKHFVIQLPATRAIPYPKLLMKYHKTINWKGEFSIIFVISYTKFTASFSKLGYLGSKMVIDKVKVNY